MLYQLRQYIIPRKTNQDSGGRRKRRQQNEDDDNGDDDDENYACVKVLNIIMPEIYTKSRHVVAWNTALLGILVVKASRVRISLQSTCLGWNGAEMGGRSLKKLILIPCLWGREKQRPLMQLRSEHDGIL